MVAPTSLFVAVFGCVYVFAGFYYLKSNFQISKNTDAMLTNKYMIGCAVVLPVVIALVACLQREWRGAVRRGDARGKFVSLQSLGLRKERREFVGGRGGEPKV